MNKPHPTQFESRRDWHAIAKRVIKGEFKRRTESETESIVIGLRGYDTEECQAALKAIDPQGKFQNGKL